MHAPTPRRRRPLLAHLLSGIVTAALLAACGGGVDSEEDHDHDHDHDAVTIDTAGRLVTIEAGATTLRIHDLDSGSVEVSHLMQSPPSAVHASPRGRYAVVMQRTQDRVQFVDGGIWQEEHGDPQPGAIGTPWAGDVHTEGNPNLHVDPQHRLEVARALAERLGQELPAERAAIDSTARQPPCGALATPAGLRRAVLATPEHMRILWLAARLPTGASPGAVRLAA